MKNEIREFIINVCGYITSIIVIFFFFTLWLFSYNQINEPLKEVWNSTISLSSALATIGAAIIGSKLYSDWRSQHNANLELNYISEILSSLRNNLILMAPVLNNLIVSGEKYTNNDIVTKIEIDNKNFDEIYANHKKTFLLFREYNYIFLDDKNYLLFLRLFTLTEKALLSILTIQKIENDIDKLNYITQQLIRVPLPSKVKKGVVTIYTPEDLLPIDIFGQIEVFYIDLVKKLAKNNFK
ncbi:hypothetical protein [Acinetobacter nosocomialis]|jgi:hypothetical protein|uniref:hypothetical protein n=1 Tax=Acinetobacter nosocomialis TaxID=106654 RepID=UPI00125090EB|nr:hypothetical protein [Acinetobacter nosocomialis]